MASFSEKGRYYCNHCGEKVSKTLYYAHKKLYYDVTLKQWRSGVACTSGTGGQCAKDKNEHDNFTFSDSDSTELSELISHYMYYSTNIFLNPLWITDDNMDYEGDVLQDDPLIESDLVNVEDDDISDEFSFNEVSCDIYGHTCTRIHT